MATKATRAKLKATKVKSAAKKAAPKKAAAKALKVAPKLPPVKSKPGQKPLTAKQRAAIAKSNVKYAKEQLKETLKATSKAAGEERAAKQKVERKRFAKGDIVRWTSGTYAKVEKEGSVVAIVPADSKPRNQLVTTELTNDGVEAFNRHSTRKHETYIVKVTGVRNRRKPYYYRPNVGTMQKVM